MGYYTYIWLREDGSPYYIGKGSTNRAWTSGRNHRPPKNQNRIQLMWCRDEQEALDQEALLISCYGRKDIRTGCLRNRSNGYDDPPRRDKWPEEIKKKMSEAHKGVPMPKEKKLAISQGMKRRLAEDTSLREKRLAQLRQCKPIEWTPQLRKRIGENNTRTHKGMKYKKVSRGF